MLEGFVRGEDEAEKERRLIEGYRRIPPGGKDEWGDVDAWLDWAARRAELMEPWEDE